MKLVRFGTAWLLALGLCLAGPALAQGAVDQPDGPWTHSATGVQFPQAVGEYNRNTIHEFDANGNDAGVGYVLRTDQGVLSVTVYVYPAKPGLSCLEAFKSTTTHIENYEGSEMLSEGMASAPDGNHPGSALYARYRVPEGAVRDGYPELISDAYVYCARDGEWLVKYRANWSGSEATFPDAMVVLQAIEWPEDLLPSD